jgi:hypothetical protein
VEVNVNIVSNIQDAIAKVVGFATAIPEAFEVVGETVGIIHSRMAEEGSPISYPVDWDSEKQREAFFATGGFGKGIPYQRQGVYEAGWKEGQTSAGYELANAHPAGAIGGTPEGWQSRIHRGRWNNLATVLTTELGSLIGKLLDRLAFAWSSA